MIIKYNAWDKEDKRMLSWDEIWEKELVRDIFVYDGRYIPLQFTGKYITGTAKEIYIGDIIRCKYYKHSENDLILDQEVYFNNGTFALRAKNTKFTMDDCVYTNCPISWPSKMIKKLGNIYEGLKIDL